VLSYSETPLVELKMEAFHAKQVRILIQREDLNHPFISGNKWWKLKYNIEEALKQGKKTLLTFGGAYSNHIYATAAAAHEVGLKSIGVIRGEATLPLNPTLTFAHTQGMHLYYVSREVYRKKTAPEFIAQLHDQFGDFYLIPEGGTNELALKGTQELGGKLLTEIEFDYLCLPVGTGGTMAGIINALQGKKEIIGFSSLKGDFLENEIRHLLDSSRQFNNWKMDHNYHFGGYAKISSDLKEFINNMEHRYDLMLDPIYTAKTVYGVIDLMKKDYFKQGSTVLILHTGGLQGRNGMEL
jgi:1-aminocyclopropane-1-carboxylate deaminase